MQYQSPLTPLSLAAGSYINLEPAQVLQWTENNKTN